MSIEINQRKIGPGQPCFIIAEAGGNHNGEISLARELVDAACDTGVDAIKFQTYITEKVTTDYTPKATYQKHNTGEEESFIEMGRRLELTYDEFAELQAYCTSKGVLFLSTPFDFDSATFLHERLDIPLFKISSGDVTTLPFLAHIAGFGKPVILSTGMANLGEVEAAVRTIFIAGCPELILLQCVSNYPAAPEDVNLRAMDTMARAFRVPIGYSDHVSTNEVAFAAVALGACVIEKHYTLDRDMPGPDHQASLLPHELKALVEGIRKVEVSLGSGVKMPAALEAETAMVSRRSLVAARPLDVGHVLKSEDMILLKPGTGLPASFASHLVGRALRKPLRTNEQLSLDVFTDA
ncbi:MAG: N,N'-diacetyllegionaminate synthase [Kiritimatiellia bacterium]|jgi:N,N'-diacetyllegionaminate synthase